MLSIFTDVQQALACLRRGEVIAYPTEGVYGLGCLASDRKSCERIIQLKQRSQEQGLIVLISAWSQVDSWVRPLSMDQQHYLHRHGKEFVTWLLPANNQAPYWLTGGRTTLAVRLPVWPPLLELCRAIAQPIVSTSANPHGKPTAMDANSVKYYFEDSIDCIWDHPCGEKGQASSIISLQSGKKIR